MYVIGSFTSRWLLLVPLVLLKVIFVTARPSPDVEASESHGSPADSDRDSITKLGGSRTIIEHEYEISILDTTGHSHAQNFPIFHSSPVTSSNPLAKRGYSRPLDVCPDEELFLESRCLEATSPQSYVLKCVDGWNNSWYFRRCAPTEVCIQGIPKPNPPLPNGQLVPPTLKSYCVSADNFRKIAQDRLAHETKPGIIGVKYNVPAGTKMAFEAVLTGQNMNESIFAESLRMSAQTLDMSNNVHHWRSQVGGTTGCRDCARILIAPVPERTQRIVMNIVLKAGAAGGLLFLSSVAI